MKEELKKENQEFEKDKYVGVFQKSKNFGFVVLDDRKIKTFCIAQNRNNGIKRTVKKRRLIKK